MPSLGDSAFIFILALILFGPKKLPELARQLGKLMAEFRRASNEFRMQMDEELRLADQAEQQKKISAMEAAAPLPPLLTDNSSSTPDAPDFTTNDETTLPTTELVTAVAPTPIPIATEGELSIMPPSTGLPTGRSALASILDAIPHAPEPESSGNTIPSTDHFAIAQHPDRNENPSSPSSTSEAPLHG